ncbi:MAG: VOC family protein [Candidatus Azobacteroides sp.]|nr:VOC family protein [Candidatus Azobacteroides sp.]
MKSNKRSPVQKVNIVIDCKNAGSLAEFYSDLLGWKLTHPHSNGWAAITSLSGMVIAFQEIESYQPPVWPWQDGKQSQMLHLDFVVENLEETVGHAVNLGAKVADQQYFNTSRIPIGPGRSSFLP